MDICCLLAALLTSGVGVAGFFANQNAGSDVPIDFFDYKQAAAMHDYVLFAQKIALEICQQGPLRVLAWCRSSSVNSIARELLSSCRDMLPVTS